MEQLLNRVIMMIRIPKNLNDYVVIGINRAEREKSAKDKVDKEGAQ